MYSSGDTDGGDYILSLRPTVGSDPVFFVITKGNREIESYYRNLGIRRNILPTDGTWWHDLSGVPGVPLWSLSFSDIDKT